jgi:integrase
MSERLEKISRHPGIYRVLVRDKVSGKHQEPSRGAKYVASMDLGQVNGKRRRIKRYFETFAEAKAFRQDRSTKDAVREALKPKSSLLFRELAGRWIEDMLPHLESTTQDRYRSYLKHFKPLDDLEVEKIEPATIDAWIRWVKRPEYLCTLNASRLGFDHEFTVLRGIFNYYTSRFNRNFRPPFLRDHNKMLRVREGETLRKDLTVEEFGKFITALREVVGGTRHEVIYYLALTQYAIYGRIQDAAALHFEDFDFDRGKILIRRKVQWARVKGRETKIVKGSKTNGGKEVPISDFAARVFREWILKSGTRSGLLFHFNGEIVTYRQIGHRYDQALVKAGLPFRGTHLIRHAALSEHYDTCKDILATAKVAGHSDLRATERYAKARDERVIETQKQMDVKLRNLLPGLG